MTERLYPKGYDGDPISLQAGHYLKQKKHATNNNIIIRDAELLRFACCDCGMVHTIATVIKKKKRVKDRATVVIHMWSERARTAQLRRHNYGYLQQGRVGRWEMFRTVSKTTV